MSTLARISVIIPCYNRATLIGATITNMISQSLAPFEIIVVDDGSTDNSVDIITSFGKKVKLIRQSNQGPGAARNAGLLASTGDYIQFMDSDDLASRNKLEEQYNALIQSKADFAYGPWVRCRITDNSIEFLDSVLQSGPVPPSKPLLEWFLSGWSLVFQNCLFSKTILNKAGTYRTDLMPSEDSEYFVRILMAGAKPVHTPGVLVFYREHNVNKITSTGTSAIHRAKDWSHYLNVTGKLLDRKLPGMQLSTKIALSSSVQNHNEYCRANGIESLTNEHPFNMIKFTGKRMLIPAYNFYSKLMRRLKASPDFSPAFATKPVTTKHYKLAEEIGFRSNKNLSGTKD